MLYDVVFASFMIFAKRRSVCVHRKGFSFKGLSAKGIKRTLQHTALEDGRDASGRGPTGQRDREGEL